MDITVSLLRKRIASSLQKPTTQLPKTMEQQDRFFAPQTIEDVEDLATIADDESFLKEAYRRILGRESDPAGFASYLEQLRRDVPRRAILLDITNSQEARNRRAAYSGAQASTANPPGVQLKRFDAIDQTLAELQAELVTRTDTIAEKTDAALWTLSEKFDSHAAIILNEQREFRKAIESLTAKINRLVADLSLPGTPFPETATLRPRSPLLTAGDVVVSQLEGLIVGVPATEWRMAAYHAFRGPLEPGVIEFFRTVVKPGDVVIDVGANVGVYTLLAAALLQGRGKVHSFEPTPRTYRLLKDNVQVNGFLELGMVELHQTAVTDQAGVARLWTFDRDCGQNTLFVDPQADKEIEVKTTTLDEALKDEPHIDVVKIDAEGAEPLVFKGMAQIIGKNPGIKIILEFAPGHLRRAGFDPSVVLDSLTASGFTIRQINDDTGVLEPASNENLCKLRSANLFLTRN